MSLKEFVYWYELITPWVLLASAVFFVIGMWKETGKMIDKLNEQNND